LYRPAAPRAMGRLLPLGWNTLWITMTAGELATQPQPSAPASRRALGPTAGERRPPGVCRAAAAFLDPARYGVHVGPGHPAQPSGGPGQRLIRLALAGPLEDPGHLGQQVGPAPGQRAQFGQRGRLLVLGELVFGTA
jgi:hypothetical protein